MSTLAAGSTVTITLGAGDTLTVATASNAEGSFSVVEYGTANAATGNTVTPSVSRYGPPAIAKTFGPYRLGAQVTIASSRLTLDYTYSSAPVGGQFNRSAICTVGDSRLAQAWATQGTTLRAATTPATSSPG